MVSVASTPGGSGPGPKKSEAGPENTTPEQVVVAWCGWAWPWPTADDSLKITVSVVTSVTVKVNATGMPWPFAPTIWPTPLLFSLPGTDTVTTPIPTQLRSTTSLPGGAGPDAAAPPVNMANAATIVATPHSSPRCI